MSAHAEFAPSSMHLTVACLASHRLRKPFLDTPRTPEQMEGDAAHWLALEWQEGRRHGMGVRAPNSIEIDAGMIMGAELWCSVVPPDAVGEVPVLAQRIHARCWGTPDARHLIPSQHRPRGCIIRVWDYKYGHRYVDPFENWQGVPYLSGLIDEAIAQGYLEEEIYIEFCIVQPRSYHRNGAIQYWRKGNGQLLTAIDLRPYINICHMAVEESQKPDAKATVGPHCLDCEARHVCVALQRATTREVISFSQVGERLGLTAHQAGCELALIDDAMTLLKARKTGLEQQVESLLRGSQAVPHWGLEPGQARLKWKVPLDEVFALGDALGHEFRHPVEAITPTQARDRFKLTERTMSAYSERPPAAMKLARIDPTEAKKVFGK